MYDAVPVTFRAQLIIVPNLALVPKFFWSLSIWNLSDQELPTINTRYGAKLTYPSLIYCRKYSWLPGADRGYQPWGKKRGGGLIELEAERSQARQFLWIENVKNQDFMLIFFFTISYEYVSFGRKEKKPICNSIFVYERPKLWWNKGKLI